MQAAARPAVAGVADQSLDLLHFRDQLTMEALKARLIDDELRLGSHTACILDRSSGSGQQRISVSGHLYGVIVLFKPRRERAVPYCSPCFANARLLAGRQ